MSECVSVCVWLSVGDVCYSLALQCNCYLQHNKVLIRFGTKPGL